MFPLRDDTIFFSSSEFKEITLHNKFCPVYAWFMQIRGSSKVLQNRKLTEVIMGQKMISQLNKIVGNVTEIPVMHTETAYFTTPRYFVVSTNNIRNTNFNLYASMRQDQKKLLNFVRTRTALIFLLYNIYSYFFSLLLYP